MQNLCYWNFQTKPHQPSLLTKFSTNRMSSFTELLQNLYYTLEKYLHKAERTCSSSVSILKVIREWPFFKSGDRCSFLLTIKHFFLWVSEERKDLSSLQTPYNKLENYLSLSVYKSIYTKKVSFFQQKIIAILSANESGYWYI